MFASVRAPHPTKPVWGLTELKLSLTLGKSLLIQRIMECFGLEGTFGIPHSSGCSWPGIPHSAHRIPHSAHGAPQKREGKKSRFSVLCANTTEREPKNPPKDVSPLLAPGVGEWVCSAPGSILSSQPCFGIFGAGIQGCRITITCP